MNVVAITPLGATFCTFFLNSLVVRYNKVDWVALFIADILPDATPPNGKVHPFRKKSVTFEPNM